MVLHPTEHAQMLAGAHGFLLVYEEGEMAGISPFSDTRSIDHQVLPSFLEGWSSAGAMILTGTFSLLV